MASIAAIIWSPSGLPALLGNVTRLIAVETQLIWTMSFYMTNTSTQETYTDFLG